MACTLQLKEYLRRRRRKRRFERESSLSAACARLIKWLGLHIKYTCFYIFTIYCTKVNYLLRTCGCTCKTEFDWNYMAGCTTTAIAIPAEEGKTIF
jgi:hypothetical protein